MSSSTLLDVKMNNRPIRGKMAHKAGYASRCGSVVIDQNVLHLNSSHTAAWLVTLSFKLRHFTCPSDVSFASEGFTVRLLDVY